MESDQLSQSHHDHVDLDKARWERVALCIATVRTWLVLFWLHWLGGGGLFCRAVSVVVGNNRHFLGLRLVLSNRTPPPTEQQFYRYI
jgi:hypothetical protein